MYFPHPLFLGSVTNKHLQDGYYVRYAVIAAIFAVIVLILIFAHFHAQRRIKKGLQPLAYHRWLVRRRNPYPPQNTYAYYQPNTQQQPPPGQAYPMNGYYGAHGAPPGGVEGQQGWAPPPPAYGQHTWDTPPNYAPPTGASKAAPDQNVNDLSAIPNGESSSGLHAPAQAHQGPPRNEHVITQ